MVLPQYIVRLSVCPSATFRYPDHIGWNTSKIISPPNSDDCNVEILAQSSADFALTHNFDILGASRGYLCDSAASCSNNLKTSHRCRQM